MEVSTLFLGSNWESLGTLKRLHEDKRFKVIGIVTQPDKPVGRKRKLQATPVKEFGIANGIEVFHTENKKDRYKEALEKFSPELVVCKNFGEIIPEFFLEAPKYKSINIHFSLLPKYRGAVPIQAAILNGDDITGFTIVRMVHKLDAGEILYKHEEKILPEDTNQSLRERMVNISAQVLPDILEKWIKGEIEAHEQDESEATYCSKADISRDKAEINWTNMEPAYIERMIRAFIPWPVAWTYLSERRFKIFRANLIDNSADSIHLPSGGFTSREERLFIGTKDPNWLIQPLEVQIEGRERMSAAEFLRGQDL